MYSCPLCTKSFKTSSNLNHHMVSHTKEKPHKCLKCPAAFGRKGSLKQHIKSVHDGIKQIRSKNSHCPLCSFKCSNQSVLQIHMRKHTAERPFHCDVPNCGHKTKYQSALSWHFRQVHSSERPFECPSDGCDYKGKTREAIRSHLKVHSDKKPFACQVLGCNYTCKTTSNLAGHASRAHSDEKPFKCSTCDFRANNRSKLQQHQLTHRTVKRFQCHTPSCGFSSHRKEKFDRHFDAKHRKKDVRCTEPGCNFKCGSITLLKEHLKRNVLPIWKCPGHICSYSTKSRTSLVLHISRFHQDIQPATVVGPGISHLQIAGTADAMDTLHCRFPNCGYLTKFPHHYDRHTITHKKEEQRKHVCSFCYSRFRHLCVLKAHVQRHVREKPYSCSHCKYTNVDCFELVKHARRTHQIHVIPRGKEDQVTKCGTCGESCLSYSEFVLHSMSHLRPIVVLERLRVHIA